MGYDSESKGFHIYWPTKRSVTVKRNVVFNDGDVTGDATAVIPGNLSEGEKEKIIQNPENNTTEDDPIKNTSSEPHLENNTNLSVDPEAQNTVPFLSTPETSDAVLQDPIEDEPNDKPGLGRGQWAQRKPPGAYKQMNECLSPLKVNAMFLGDADDDRIGIYLPEDDDELFATLPPHFATVGAMGAEPASLDEALRGPNAKEW